MIPMKPANGQKQSCSATVLPSSSTRIRKKQPGWLFGGERTYEKCEGYETFHEHENLVEQITSDLMEKQMKSEL
ncbi:MAG: hypothetical protein ACJA16_002243 [Akkermansiaceae bacterium]|jgi:hypothetical protein